jgi:hypothetical protein
LAYFLVGNLSMAKISRKRTLNAELIDNRSEDPYILVAHRTVEFHTFFLLQVEVDHKRPPDQEQPDSLFSAM